jgi:hypothetical protein
LGLLITKRIDYPVSHSNAAGTTGEEKRKREDLPMSSISLDAMLAISAFLVGAAVIAQFSPVTRGRHYEEISP